jgi:hypothetical protein
MKTPLSQKTVKKEKDVSYKSDMIGLPSKVVKQQKTTMKEASSGPRYEIKKNGSGVSSKKPTPLNMKKEYGKTKSPAKMKKC